MHGTVGAVIEQICHPIIGVSYPFHYKKKFVFLGSKPLKKKFMKNHLKIYFEAHHDS